MHDALDRLDIPRVVRCTLCFSRLTSQGSRTRLPLVILSLQHPSGVFAGDTFGELDTRFLYCAVSALSLLGALDQLDRDRTVAYLVQCRNFDGGFGSVAGAESHAAQGVSQGSRPVFAFFLIVFASDIDSTT